MKHELAKFLSKKIPLKENVILNLLETPPNAELGDFALPCFVLAKSLKNSPNKIAEELAKKITDKNFEKVEAKGPYLNFFINKKMLAQKTIYRIKTEKEKFGSQKIKSKVLIEFPGPNTNKPLHIGHARNIVLGQATSNILKFSGNEVKIVNINNDKGTHICKSMVAYEKFGKDKTPESEKIKPDKFVGNFYVLFAKELEKNPSLEKEAKECLKNWEAGDKKTLGLWKKMNVWALKGFKETYKKFNLKIDKNYFESKIYRKGKEIALEALKKGIVEKKEDGAIAVNLEKQKLGEKIILRGDGTSLYITQDLYLALLRKKEFNFDKMIYVVASEQEYHFKVLIEILKLLEYSWANYLFHLSYGLVHLKSGRLKSREGNVVDSDDLVAEVKMLAKQEIKKRNSKISEKELDARATAVAMAAIRYYFLKVERNRTITFEPKEALRFEGDTGPYLLYTYARARSILRASAKKPNFSALVKLSPSESALVKKLSEFPEKVKKSYEELSPNLIANYSFELAQTFNEFYHSSKVVGSKNESARLALIEAFSQVLSLK